MSLKFLGSRTLVISLEKNHYFLGVFGVSTLQEILCVQNELLYVSIQTYVIISRHSLLSNYM